MAAIITTQTLRNHVIPPRCVHGPSSMPRIWPAVHHHPAMATANNAVTSPRRARAAWNAARRPRLSTRPSVAVVMSSGGPGELGSRQTRLALELDAERVDA